MRDSDEDSFAESLDLASSSPGSSLSAISENGSEEYMGATSPRNESVEAAKAASPIRVSGRRRSSYENALANKQSTSKRRKLVDRAELSLPGDGFHWRKYGQKVLADDPIERSYYACVRKSHKEKCPAKKVVNRRLNCSTPKVQIQYLEKHNHTPPPAKTPREIIICRPAPAEECTEEGTKVGTQLLSIRSHDLSLLSTARMLPCDPEEGLIYEAPAAPTFYLNESRTCVPALRDTPHTGDLHGEPLRPPLQRADTGLLCSASNMTETAMSKQEEQSEQQAAASQGVQGRCSCQALSATSEAVPPSGLARRLQDALRNAPVTKRARSKLGQQRNRQVVKVEKVDAGDAGVVSSTAASQEMANNRGSQSLGVSGVSSQQSECKVEVKEEQQQGGSQGLLDGGNMTVIDLADQLFNTETKVQQILQEELSSGGNNDGLLNFMSDFVDCIGSSSTLLLEETAPCNEVREAAELSDKRTAVPKGELDDCNVQWGSGSLASESSFVDAEYWLPPLP